MNLNKLKNMEGLSSRCHNIKSMVMSPSLCACASGYRFDDLFENCPNFNISVCPGFDADFLVSIFVRINKPILAAYRNGLFFYVATSFILYEDPQRGGGWYVTLLSSSIRCGY